VAFSWDSNDNYKLKFAESKAADDTGAVNYDGTNSTWNAMRAYGWNTTNAEQGVNAGENGLSVTPVAGRTYFIKEVPAEAYLQPYIYYTFHGVMENNNLVGSGKIGSLFAISNIDDTMYFDTGFVIKNNSRQTAHVVSAMVIQPNNIPGNAVTLTPADLFSTGGAANRLTYLTLYNELQDSSANIVNAGDSFEISRYWKTPDGLYVTGTLKTIYSATGNVTGFNAPNSPDDHVISTTLNADE
jgi:hypothetical protein